MDDIIKIVRILDHAIAFSDSVPVVAQTSTGFLSIKWAPIFVGGILGNMSGGPLG